jgi:hypothetical protein
MRLWQLAVFVGAACTLGGCALDVGGQAGEQVGAQTQPLVATFAESPALVTFYSESGFWGDQLTVEAPVEGPLETVRLITKTQIQSANLLRRISSVRLTCGSRKAQIALMDSYNTSSGLGGWSEFSKGDSIYCNPGETKGVELHTDLPALADNVGSAYFVAHAVDAGGFDFSYFLKNSWDSKLGDLPSGATAKGGGKLRLIGETGFRLRQDLTLDDWKCGARGGILELQAHMFQDRHFSVIVASTYVDTGWGDAWGCRGKMQQALQSAATDAAAKLEDGLEQLILLAGEHSRFYFVPYSGVRNFEVYGGN